MELGSERSFALFFFAIEGFDTLFDIFVHRACVLFYIRHTWFHQIFWNKSVECREFIFEIWVFELEKFINVLDRKLPNKLLSSFPIGN